MKVNQDAPPELTDLGPLPLRVRNKKGEVVGSGVTGTPIEVPDGNYLLTVLLPDGREIDLKEFGGSADQSAAQMMSDPGAMAAGSALAAGTVAASATDLIEMQGAIWRGDWLGSWERGAPAVHTISGTSLTLSSQTQVFLDRREDSDQLVVLQLEDRLRCTVVPSDECGSCGTVKVAAPGIAASLTTMADGPMVVFRSTVAEEANTLLSFVELGVLTNMVAVTEDEVRRGEQALQGSGGSALRAITGAYVLLRSNALEGLSDWLAQLDPLAATLPDLLPLRAELAARSGDHENAVQLIDDWIGGERCPWFRSGLSYMHERVKLYLDVTDNQKAAFNLPASVYRRFQVASERLERILPTMLTSRYIATFDLPLSKSSA